MTPYRRHSAWLAVLLLGLGSLLQPSMARAQDKSQTFKIAIKGEVVAPGSYAISNDFSVIDAIEMAGGFTARALRSAVEISRVERAGGNARKVVYRMDYTDYPMNSANADFKLKPGDVIFVPADPTYGK